MRRTGPGSRLLQSRASRRSIPPTERSLSLSPSTELAISIVPAAELTSAQITEVYVLAAQSGLTPPPGFLESTHFAHNPLTVQARQHGRLVGFQAHSTYRMRTPFHHKPMPVIYGGLALQDLELANHGVARRMMFSYMRSVLGPCWALRRYAFVTGTANPRLLQILDIQLRLFLPSDGTLTPQVARFVQHFLREQRSITTPPVSDQLLRPVPESIVGTDITSMWALLYCATKMKYNEMAYALGLVGYRGGRWYTGPNCLYVVGCSSLKKTAAVGLATTRRSVTRQHLNAPLRHGARLSRFGPLA